MDRPRTSLVLRATAVVALGLAAGTAAFTTALSTTVHAQRERRNRIPPTSKMLQTVARLTCSFPATASATWEGSEPNAQTKKLATPAVITVFNIDTQDGSAEVNGGGFRRAEGVTVKLAGSTLHVMEIGLDGEVGVLTVFARESHDGRLQAVYSHASYAENGFGTPAPPNMSQFYGDCATATR